MPVQIHDKNCDEHGLSFAHRVVNARYGDGGMTPDFIICTRCDHWIAGEHVECRCPYQCHYDYRKYRVNYETAQWPIDRSSNVT